MSQTNPVTEGPQQTASAYQEINKVLSDQRAKVPKHDSIPYDRQVQKKSTMAYDNPLFKDSNVKNCDQDSHKINERGIKGSSSESKGCYNAAFQSDTHLPPEGALAFPETEQGKVSDSHLAHVHRAHTDEDEEGKGVKNTEVNLKPFPEATTHEREGTVKRISSFDNSCSETSSAPVADNIDTMSSQAVTQKVVLDGTVDGEKKILAETKDAKKAELPERETWGKKVDFLLSVIGFAVDLGNVWRFPYVCYSNGGGAFLIPYIVMLIFGGLPLFYMELALGQYQRSGCLTVWKRICPMFKGIGFGIIFIATWVSFYYNTIIAWAFYYLFSSMASEVPWATCGNPWNTDNCTTFRDRSLNKTLAKNNYSKLASHEFFYRGVLELQGEGHVDDIGNIGPVKWQIALCLMAVFVLVYFALWKGVKTSGKAVWFTATMPYIVLFILLIRGVTLEGSLSGILFYLRPEWDRLLVTQVWIDAAAQIFFSLGPGFGVLLALSSYNKFHNNCYSDALLTSSINCATSFLAGFVVFSVLGHMAFMEGKDIKTVAQDGPGLVFVVYPEAIAALPGSVFWAIIFFLMLITLGLDSTFGGLEALITGICDEFPQTVGKRRELFVAGLMVYCFLGALSTTTEGGYNVFVLLDSHGVPISILFIVFIEAIAVNWFYGVNRFSGDIETMLGFQPGIYWKICWVAISPVFLLTLFILSIVGYKPPVYTHDEPFPGWAIAIGWMITLSSLIPIPTYVVYLLLTSKGGLKQRLLAMIEAKEKPPVSEKEAICSAPATHYL
ncbi:sodium-dependent serotonin transporter isoform X3 [Lingula anatina]|uniref:Transporter n=1 Tax=Lingula anatina TaxID=7574 RepID=A0A1S3I236_LINAN|nr:sodium-dependent serotonin transporter isoform X3 [Lingula anatina]|eukprot:XP_013392308.1 sodium-dependent serotonin transporter isoform X3 [Lingula anatina]